MNAISKIINDILVNGARNTGQKGHFIQILGYQGPIMPVDEYLYDIFNFQKLDVNKMIKELEWQLSGEDDIRPLLNEHIYTWSKQVYKFHEKNINRSYETWLNGDYKDFTYKAPYSYSYIFRKYWNNFKNSVMKKPHSRNLIFSFIDNSAREYESIQQPCIASFQLSPINAKEKIYDVLINWRSCDASAGLSWDLFQIIYLALMLAASVKYKIRNIVPYFNNIHVYNNNIKVSCELVNKRDIDIVDELIYLANEGFVKMTVLYNKDADEKRVRVNLNV